MAQTTTMTLTEFLTARLDEDEAVARAAIADDMGETGGFEDAYEILIEPPSGVGIAQGGFGEAAARMICTYAVPARVLREVEAKRAIVGEHVAMFGGGLVEFCATCGWNETHITEQGGCFDRGHVHYPCPTLRHLAAIYSDHPSYDEAWRP